MANLNEQAPRLFLSYARHEHEEVQHVARVIEKAGFSPFVDQAGLEGGHPWWDQLLLQIQTCDAFVPVLSPHYLDSVPCRREAEWAAALNKPVLPIMIKQIDPAVCTEYIASTQFVTFFESNEDALLVLTRALWKLPACPPLPDVLPTRPVVLMSPVTGLVTKISQRLDDGAEMSRAEQLVLLADLKSLYSKLPDAARPLLAELQFRDEVTAGVHAEITELLAAVAPAEPARPISQPAPPRPVDVFAQSAAPTRREPINAQSIGSTREALLEKEAQSKAAVERGDLTTARDLARDAWAGWERLEGSVSNNSVKSAERYASILRALEDPESFTVFEHALTAMRELLGPTHHDALLALCKFTKLTADDLYVGGLGGDSLTMGYSGSQNGTLAIGYPGDWIARESHGTLIVRSPDQTVTVRLKGTEWDETVTSGMFADSMQREAANKPRYKQNTFTVNLRRWPGAPRPKGFDMRFVGLPPPTTRRINRSWTGLFLGHAMVPLNDEGEVFVHVYSWKEKRSDAMTEIVATCAGNGHAVMFDATAPSKSFAEYESLLWAIGHTAVFFPLSSD